MEYVKKSSIFEAIKFDGSMESIEKIIKTFELSDENYNFSNGFNGKLHIHTSKGTMTVKINEYIIKNQKGFFYISNPDIFEETHIKIKRL